MVEGYYRTENVPQLDSALGLSSMTLTSKQNQFIS